MENKDEVLNFGLKSYYNGNYDTAFNIFEDLSQQGNGTALFCLGVMYEKGLYAEANTIRAQELYMSAAISLGNADIGVMRIQNNKPQNIILTMATHEHLGAQEVLARMYETAYYKRKSGEYKKQALYWYKHATKKGGANIYRSLGRFYENTWQLLNAVKAYKECERHSGKGATKDLKRAFLKLVGFTSGSIVVFSLLCILIFSILNHYYS